MNIYTKEPQKQVQACVIWMHGLGADAQDMLGLADQLPLSYAIRHVAIDAPIRPVTLNNRLPMRAWYDIVGLRLIDREDCEGIAQSETIIRQVIDEQLAQGIQSEKIFLAGFSQGGAMAMLTALHSPVPLAGVISLSSYLPKASVGQVILDKATPLFIASGRHDPLVLPEWSKMSVEGLKQHGFTNISWREYPMEHAVCAEEIADIAAWLTQQIHEHHK